MIKDMQRALLEAVGARITALGFDGKPVGQSFLRRIPDGRVSFHLAFVKHPEDFDVVADVGVRFD
jgi:ribosomal protein S12 methylthiotransferase accessory factor YcaO